MRRATAVAIFLFIVNLIGYGLGPLAIGILSDIRMDGLLQASGYGAGLSLAACKGSESALLAALGPDQARLCLVSSAEGLRQSLATAVLVLGAAGLIYLYLCRGLQRDLVAKMH